MEYIFHILVLVSIYVVLAVSLDLLVGQTGLLSIAQAAFFGVGAYAAALVTTRLGAPFLVGTLTGVAVAALISVVVSLPSLRLHDDYFVIATFGFQIVLYNVLNNWTDLTRGPMGISGIPLPAIPGWTFHLHIEFLIAALLIAAFAYGVVQRVSASPFGRVLRAIRGDEVFTRSLGKNTLWFKVTVFALSAALAGLSGSFYAHYVSYIDPTSFTVMESVLVISMVIIGGAGSTWGPLVGAVILVTLPEALRFVGLPQFVAANLRQFIYGALLVVMMVVRPRGLVGRYGLGR